MAVGGSSCRVMLIGMTVLPNGAMLMRHHSTDRRSNRICLSAFDGSGALVRSPNCYYGGSSGNRADIAGQSGRRQGHVMRSPRSDHVTAGRELESQLSDCGRRASSGRPAAFCSPTTLDPSHLRPVRRPVTAEAFFTPGPARSWACILQGPREK